MLLQHITVHVGKGSKLTVFCCPSVPSCYQPIAAKLVHGLPQGACGGITSSVVSECKGCEVLQEPRRLWPGRAPGDGAK